MASSSLTKARAIWFGSQTVLKNVGDKKILPNSHKRVKVTENLGNFGF